MAIQRTPNRYYPFPEFDDEPFIDVMQEFAEMVDRDVGGIVAIGGVAVRTWDTSVAYIVTDRVLDQDNLQFYLCLVAHTSGTGSFEEDRLAHPTYWQSIGSVFVPRGQWAQSTTYRVMDHVYDVNEGIAAICVLEHTSTASGTIRTDSTKWAFIIDLQLSVSAAQEGQLILASQIFGS